MAGTAYPVSRSLYADWQSIYLTAHLDSERWPEGFTHQDGGIVRDLGDDQVLYWINYENVYHLKYKMQTRGDIARDVITEKYVLGMRILMIGYEHALRVLM